MCNYLEQCLVHDKYWWWWWVGGWWWLWWWWQRWHDNDGDNDVMMMVVLTMMVVIMVVVVMICQPLCLSTLYALFHLMPQNSMQQIPSLFYKWVTCLVPHSWEIVKSGSLKPCVSDTMLYLRASLKAPALAG